jgi:hypothetical protein
MFLDMGLTAIATPRAIEDLSYCTFDYLCLGSLAGTGIY